MTRKHFERIASVLNRNYRAETPKGRRVVLCIANGLALEFQSVNSRFDTERFRNAVRDLS